MNFFRIFSSKKQMKLFSEKFELILCNAKYQYLVTQRIDIMPHKILILCVAMYIIFKKFEKKYSSYYMEGIIFKAAPRKINRLTPQSRKKIPIIKSLIKKGLERSQAESGRIFGEKRQMFLFFTFGDKKIHIKKKAFTKGNDETFF